MYLPLWYEELIGIHHYHLLSCSVRFTAGMLFKIFGSDAFKSVLFCLAT